MKTKLTSMVPTRHSSWRNWLAGLFVVCFLGLYGLAATHHHDKASDENACAICQAIDHQPLDLSVPPIAPVVTALILFFSITRRYDSPRIVCPRYTHYYSQAPPRGSVA